MTAITYDYIKKLEQAGFTSPQVEVLALPVAEFATKSELVRVEEKLTHKIENAETRLEKRMDERFDLVDKRFDLIERQIATLATQIASLGSLLKWLTTTAIALIPIIGACISWVSHLVGH